MPPSPKQSESKSPNSQLYTPPPGIARLPPRYPSVRLPSHPPYSPSTNPIYSSSPRVSVIKPPNSTQLEEAVSDLGNFDVSGTPSSSLDWDNFQPTPEFSVQKNPIVSTVSSSIKGIDQRLNELDLSLNSEICQVEKKQNV